MTYLIGWGRDDSQPTGQNEVAITTPEELDSVLDEIEATGRPYLVDITPADDDHDVPYGLQIGVGPTPRSFAIYIGEPAGGIGYDLHLPAIDTSIVFDAGGEPTPYDPQRLRLTPDQARTAAREYVRTRQRPTYINWD